MSHKEWNVELCQILECEFRNKCNATMKTIFKSFFTKNFPTKAARRTRAKNGRENTAETSFHQLIINMRISFKKICFSHYFS